MAVERVAVGSRGADGLVWWWQGRAWDSFDLCRSTRQPTDDKTAWFVPGVKDECRVPVNGSLVVTRTRDGGETFDTLSSGLPQQHCYDIVYRHSLDVDASGERLAMGSSTGGLWISENGGDDWQSVSNSLPPIYVARFGRR